MFLEEIVFGLTRSILRYQQIVTYLHSRYVTDEDIRNFQIGYGKVLSLPSSQDPEFIRFCSESNKGRKFEDKIVFPLKDPLGRVVGISGRSLTKEFKNFILEEAKEQGFFFGLYEALPKIYSENRVYVVEGYFDSLALSKVFPNTVASLTAGLSDAQYDQLSFYCDNIVVVFDSDQPGKRASEEACLRKRVQSFNLGYKDPSKCLEIMGLDKFKQFVLSKSFSVSPF